MGQTQLVSLHNWQRKVIMKLLFLFDVHGIKKVYFELFSKPIYDQIDLNQSPQLQSAQ
jgi:hypothetical protein